MMKHMLVAALVATSPWVQAQSSPAKKELVQKLLAVQQSGLENLARGLVEQPAAQLIQAAGQAIQTQVPADKREAVGKAVESDIRKYVDESVPLVRDRAIKLAPSTIGVSLEEKFSEDELKQLLAWFDSPVNKKYQQLAPEMQSSFVQKLVSDARPVIDPKIQALQQQVRTTVNSASSPASAPSGNTPKRAAPAAKAASK